VRPPDRSVDLGKPSVSLRVRIPTPAPIACYVAAVVTAGLVMLAAQAQQLPAILEGADLRLTLLVAAVLMGELMPIRLGPGQGEVAPSTTFTFAILLTFGTAAAVLAQAVGSLGSDVVQRKRLKHLAFNVSQYVLAVVAAGLTHDLIAGPMLSSELGVLQLVAVLAGGAVFFAVNTGAVAIAVSLSSGARIKDAIAGDLIRQSATESVLIGLAPLAVVALDRNLVLLPLLALPLLAVQRAARHAQMSEHLAMHDPLTGLPNRAKFYSRLHRAITTADPGDCVALLLVDLDRFKEINDTLGHHYGDEVLRQVAQRLRQRIGEDATVARLGGDEFAILLPGLESGEAALEIAEAARRSLTAPLDAAGIRLDLGGSVGVATFPDDGSDVETLLQRADIAMYEAKSGRTGVERYSREQDANSLMRLTLAGELRRALEQGEFVTHFQPKIDLLANRAGGAEALVRWDHPQRGTIPPDVFIGIAEQTGFIVSLTMRVLDEAIRACSHWHRHGAPLTVAVNLSARVLLEPTLPDTVAAICRAHRLPADALVLEITENMVVANLDRVLPTLTRLAEHGISLSIDDFGTGYSSLEYLKLLPVAELKIDRGFVIGMRSDPRDAAIVRSAIHLGRSLGLRVVAEGVESHQHHDELTALGCDQAQGFHYSHAIGDAQLLSWAADYDEVAGVARLDRRRLGYLSSTALSR
jgi:diguanylate cyclase (GGDEF)-like protein